MSDSNDFLKFLINEDIYLIDETPETKAEEISIQDESVTADDTVNSRVSEPVEKLTTPEKAKNEILVIFDNPSATDLPTQDLEYLGKILGAIGKSTDHADFLNVAQQAPNAVGYAHIIAFTPNHKLSVPASTQQYVSVKLGDSQLIVADALNNISASTELRKKLWNVLQQVFK